MNGGAEELFFACAEATEEQNVAKPGQSKPRKAKPTLRHAMPSQAKSKQLSSVNLLVEEG